jgi:glutamine amidotransferase-like class 1 domain-containing protein 3, mitochondrial
VFPGGFGAAKNLCSFAEQGAEMSVQEDVAAVLRGFREASKPIGLCCIAPVLAAKTLSPCEVTIGQEGEVAQAIRAWGSTHVERSVVQHHVDIANKLVTTPAYMCEGAPVHEVFAGIDLMVSDVLDQVV